jgi:hypothetical protein
MARDPGGLGQSLTVDRQQWRSAAVGRPCGSRSALGSQEEPGRDQKLAQDTKTPPARVPKGNPFGAGNRPFGCGVGARVTRRTSLALPTGIEVLQG